MKVFLNCFLKNGKNTLITCTLLFSNSLQLDHINYLKLCKFLIMFMTLYMHLFVSTLRSVLSAASYVACIASVSMGYRGKELLREKREGSGRGRGRKETLTDKPLDFENRPLCLSCLTDFMLSSSIQVAFVILVLARFEILDHCIFLSNKNHTRLL